ncbi:MAG TPA: phosphatidylinositol mannoside acyltransferase [Acidimicrobiia bacterium]|nr:phosphatidylinositol mannoside acyltransferase [Acidimicrobiia bacterium]
MPDATARAVSTAYRVASVAAQRLPAQLGRPVAFVLGKVAPFAMPAARRQVVRHQQRAARGGHVAPAGAVFDSYARYWYELFRLPADVRAGIVADHFTVEGLEHLEQPLADGRGVVIALPHLGGWEWAAAWFAGRGHRPFAVVEPVEPPELFAWFARQRAEIGIDIVPLGEGVASEVLRAVRANRVVCLLSDRDLTGDGVEVEFFGERTTLPAGPATVALRTGAPLVPVAVYFRPGRGHHAVIRAPLDTQRQGRLRDDIARITQAMATTFEELIRAAPEQWHLLQPNWPSDRADAPSPAEEP